MFSKDKGLTANNKTVATGDIIAAVRGVLNDRYGQWEEPFRREVIFTNQDFTALNDGVRALMIDVLGEDDEAAALAIADHARDGACPHDQIRAAVDYALAQLKMASGFTYAQRKAIPAEWRGCAAEVPANVLMAEA